MGPPQPRRALPQRCHRPSPAAQPCVGCGTARLCKPALCVRAFVLLLACLRSLSPPSLLPCMPHAPPHRSKMGPPSGRVCGRRLCGRAPGAPGVTSASLALPSGSHPRRSRRPAVGSIAYFFWRFFREPPTAPASTCRPGGVARAPHGARPLPSGQTRRPPSAPAPCRGRATRGLVRYHCAWVLWWCCHPRLAGADGVDRLPCGG